MPPTKTAYVPRFGSQSASSQRNEPGMDQTEPSTRCHKDKRQSKRSKTTQEKISRPVLKVKITKFNPTLLVKVTKDGRTSTKVATKPAKDKTKTPGSQRRETQRANPVSAPADGDVFFFSQSSNTTNEKEKAQLSVLRTISKMLEENQLIRERLAALRQGI